MSDIVVRLGERSIAVALPQSLLADGILAGLATGSAAAAGDRTIIVSQTAERSFAIDVDRRRLEAGLTRGRVCARLLDILATQFAEIEQVPVLSAAAVGWGDGSVLIAGAPGSGKSSLAAWFIEKGFSLIGDNQIAVVDGVAALAGYRAPLTFSAASAGHLTELDDIASAPMVRTPEHIHVGIKDAWHALDGSPLCGMMIFPQHVPRSPGRVERLEAATAAMLLKAQLMPGCVPRDGHDLWHLRMAQNIPAIALRYSNYGQIEGLLDRLTRLAIDDRLSPSQFDHFISGIGQPPAALTRKYPVPQRSTRKFSPFLTIGMATYDDYDGVYFSLQAMRFYHPEILDDVEFLVIDNRPDGPCGAPLKDLERHIGNLRYIPAGDVTGTAVRERVFSEADGEFVLCMDCHVLFAPGSLRKLIDYFRSVPATNDLVQGPMMYDDLARTSTHWTEGWQGGMFGMWASDPQGDSPDDPPFEIPLQGLGIFACRRKAWPGFNAGFRGFGGEEGYIHEKFRQRGGRVLCLPALRWLHRFGRPMGASYPNRWEDRIRNYLIGFGEIGWDTADMHAHFREQLGRQQADRIFTAVRNELAAGPSAMDGQSLPFPDIEVDEPHDLNEARLRFVAEASVQVVLENFAVEKVVCLGRAAGLWADEFSRHGIVATAEQVTPAVAAADAHDHSLRLACCFEIPGIASATEAEKIVQHLTGMAATIVFAFARPQANGAGDVNRQRASWAALFARCGYRPVDCLRPALGGDPRIDSHYQQNIIVFSRATATDGKRPISKSASRPAPRGAELGVSVVMPVYNGELFLGQAIESILLQTHRHFELIVVNDGSSDRTGAIAESYERADSRVHVIHQENGGEAAAFNAGCAQARFALLARVDHDDVALPERLALQVAFMAKNEDIAAAGGAMRHIDREGKSTGNIASYPLTPEACHAWLVNSTVGPIANPTVMLRKAAFDACGGLRNQFRVASDLDLWLRMDEQYKLANQPDVLVDYRTHGANATSLMGFSVMLSAYIAKHSARMRRQGLPDPVAAWSRLELDKLATFGLPEEERSEAYRSLFNAALKTFTATKDAKYLKLADICLSLIPEKSITR
ncbi:glycosyltransferase [Taklimakanibacter lacteus]|uniref:glycosyltransferase n=1 Tax=Taklimakanibacter lacteus TaxID=2268456 RepID=UPI0013C506FF